MEFIVGEASECFTQKKKVQRQLSQIGHEGMKKIDQQQQHLNSNEIQNVLQLRASERLVIKTMNKK